MRKVHVGMSAEMPPKQSDRIFVSVHQGIKRAIAKAKKGEAGFLKHFAVKDHKSLCNLPEFWGGNEKNVE